MGKIFDKFFELIHASSKCWIDILKLGNGHQVPF